MRQTKTGLFSAAVLLFLVAVPAASSAQTSIRIVDQLGPGHLQEQVVVTVGGSSQVLYVSMQRPVAAVDFLLPGPGAYPCTLRSVTDIQGPEGIVRVTGFGQGMLRVEGGEVLAVMGNDDAEQPFPLTLVPVSVPASPQPAPALPQAPFPPPVQAQPQDSAQRQMRLQAVNREILDLQQRIASARRGARWPRRSSATPAAPRGRSTRPSCSARCTAWRTSCCNASRRSGGWNGGTDARR